MSEDVTDHGLIARLLREDGFIDEKALRYAQRVRSKLQDPQPLVEVLKSLGHVTEEQLRETLRRHRADIRIGELLVELGRIDASELASAVAVEAQGDRRVAEILVEQHTISERDLHRVLTRELGYPVREPAEEELDRALLEEAPAAWMLKHAFLPIERTEDGIVVAFPDPTDPEPLGAARTVFGQTPILPVLATQAYLHDVLGKRAGAAPRAKEQVDETRAVGIVEEILRAAVDRAASDIHVEPGADSIRVRFREDGVLITFKEYPTALGASITSRIKVLCGADIAERRRHQDGRFVHRTEGRELDLRVSVYATVHGQKIVMRLLNRDRQLIPIQEVGMAPRILQRFVDDALESPSGVILVTGPTGSGKTSTLYSCVNHINRPETSIITAEDPVEYMIDGISQCSLNPAIDLTYEETLRHIVRQDPDVIVIGEVRDKFSAETAIQAALTGHKVLTTFHTEDSIGGLLRLLNMEIEAFLISSTVVSVLAQRLIRRVCDTCSVDATASAAELRRLGYSPKDLEGARLREGRGCDACRHTGYRGRVAVFELLVLDEMVRDAVIQRRTAYEIRRISREHTGLMSLLEDGILRAGRGVTTLSEVLRMLPRLDRPRPFNELQRLLGG